ncbi:hypothetical protein HY640_02840 [Candidatus Woesearchaeota archaeon]|nr:hypothetical protein [Candidatus Woesearchaeota archaeon]
MDNALSSIKTADHNLQHAPREDYRAELESAIYDLGKAAVNLERVQNEIEKRAANGDRGIENAAKHLEEARKRIEASASLCQSVLGKERQRVSNDLNSGWKREPELSQAIALISTCISKNCTALKDCLEGNSNWDRGSYRTV